MFRIPKPRWIALAAIAGAVVALAQGLPLSNDGVSLVFGGDALIGRRFSNIQDGRFIDLMRLFQNADASFLNLEEGISTASRADPDVGEPIRVPHEMLDEMKWAGVDAVSLANNHSMNYGPEALLETMRGLDSVGINYAGGGENLDEARSPAILNVKGLRVGFLSLYSGTVGTSAIEIAGKQRPGLSLLRVSEVDLGGTRVIAPVAADVDALVHTIEKTRPAVDLLIVSVHAHWGNNTFREEFSPYQPVVARQAIDAGADLFLFHGPHVPRGVEIYKRGLIAYSLGNLFYDLKNLENVKIGPGDEQDEAWQSIVLRILIKDGRVHRVEIVPIYIERSGELYGMPRLAEPAKAQQILSRVQKLSATTRTALTLSNGFAYLNVSP